MKMIETVIVTSLVSGMIAAVATYLLCSEKELHDYKQYQEDMIFVGTAAKQLANQVEMIGSAVASWQEKIALNRHDLDVIMTEFINLKQWAYGYVSYEPRIKMKVKEQKENEQAERSVDTAVQE